MAVGERDPHTGHMTTGHEWNGIKELNTPVPKIAWFFLTATAIFSVVYWLLMPAWPLGVTYTKGLLGIDQRTTVRATLDRAALDQAVWAERISAESYDGIRADDGLMQVVRETGGRLFGDNCAVCHGTGGTGGKGYPNLAEAPRMWGGDAEAIAETLRVGINSGHSETRMSEMLAFGRDGMLERADILSVAAYVQSLSGPTSAAGETDAIAAGEQVFADNCAACHGADGTGTPEVGAPNLTDQFWIYGGDLQSVYASIHGGRQGHMPHWEGRLTEVERKILTLYVLELGSTAK